MFLYNNKSPALKIMSIWNVGFSFLILKQFFISHYIKEKEVTLKVKPKS